MAEHDGTSRRDGDALGHCTLGIVERFSGDTFSPTKPAMDAISH